jgi:hypothetical protein
LPIRDFARQRQSRNNADNVDLTPTQYAQTRMSVRENRRALIRKGALIALTKSLMRGDMKDEEVVIVADVFGDGLAQIAEVVEPSRDRRAVLELEKALKNSSEYAPFVPANLDGRSETVRVVFQNSKRQCANASHSKKQLKVSFPSQKIEARKFASAFFLFKQFAPKTKPLIPLIFVVAFASVRSKLLALNIHYQFFTRRTIYE